MAAADWSSFRAAPPEASTRASCAASAWPPIPSAAAAAFPRPRRSNSRMARVELVMGNQEYGTGPVTVVQAIRLRPARHRRRPDRRHHGRHRPHAGGPDRRFARASQSPARRFTRPGARLSRRARQIAAHLLEASAQRHRLQRRRFPRGRHRPARRSSPGRRGRARSGQIAGRHGTRSRRRRITASAGADLSQRLPHRRGRDRSRTPAWSSIERYTIVDDFGRAINPLLLEGQVHGGIVQGIGQALLEHAVYDADNGQLLAGSFMDYAMPRADDAAVFAFSTHNVPSTSNPFGVKGAGEAGAVRRPAGGDQRRRRRSAAAPEPATSTCRQRRIRVWKALNGSR